MYAKEELASGISAKTINKKTTQTTPVVGKTLRMKVDGAPSNRKRNTTDSDGKRPQPLEYLAK